MIKKEEDSTHLGGLLCEDMGTGKTVIVISLILKTKGTWCLPLEGIHLFDDFESSTLTSICMNYIRLNGMDYMNNPLPSHIKELMYNHPNPSYFISRLESKSPRFKKFDKMYLSRTTLISVPANLIIQWKNEFEKYVQDGSLSILVISKIKDLPKTSEILKYDVVITTHTIFAGQYHEDSPFLQIRWFRIVIDEAHIMGKQTNQSLFGKQLHAERKWICTGTPLPQTHVKEILNSLYGLIEFIKYQPYCDKSFYNDEIMKPIEYGMEEGISNLKQLLQDVMIRTRKEDIEVKIPNLEMVVTKIPLKRTEAFKYNEFICQIRTNFITSREVGPDFMLDKKNRRWAQMALNNLRKASTYVPGLDESEKRTCFEAILDDLKNKDLTKENRKELNDIMKYVDGSIAIKNEVSSKLDYLIQRVKELMVNEKIIIFVNFNETLAVIIDSLESAKIPFTEFHQKIQIPVRVKNLASFEKDDKVRVIVMKIDMAAFGLNIVKASRIFIVEPVLDKRIEIQAIKRAHRIGQTQTVYVEKLISSDTIDEMILEQFDKRTEELSLIHNLLRQIKLLPFEEKELYEITPEKTLINI